MMVSPQFNQDICSKIMVKQLVINCQKQGHYTFTMVKYDSFSIANQAEDAEMDQSQ